MAIARERSQELNALFNNARQDCIKSSNWANNMVHNKTGMSSFNEGNINNITNNKKGDDSEIKCISGLLHSSNEVQTFNRYAKLFAKSIATVSEDIMSLTKITAKQNVFDDQSLQITSLAERIKFTLEQLHSDLSTIEKLKENALLSQEHKHNLIKRYSSSNIFTSKKGEANCGPAKHSEAVVNTLKCELARTGQAFRSTLQQQSNQIKSSTYRRQMFTIADKPQSFESALFHDQLDHYGESQQNYEQQLIVGNNRDRYFQQRVEAVAEIEASVAQVGELFNDFSRLVQEQGESVVRIDTDVEDALRNVNAGSNELMRYLTNLSTNRGLIVKIFLILFLFLLFFGLFVIREDENLIK